MQRMLFLLFQNTQKNGCLILYYREGSFSCGGSTCYSENFLLAKMLTGIEVKEEMIKPFGYMRSQGMVYFLIRARDSSTRTPLFLKTEIFFST